MRHRTLRAFTLLELLVVLGIIVALAGVLLPALNRAREMGKRTVCLSNIRQLQMAWLAYAYDNKGRFCTARVDPVVGRTMTPDGINGRMFVAFTSWVAITNNLLDLPSGKMWPYAKDKRVYFCPDDDSVRTGPEGIFYDQPLTSYIMNGFLGTIAPYTNGSSNAILIDEVHGVKLQALNQIKHPAGVFVFIEADPRSNPNYFLPPYYSPYGASYVSAGSGDGVSGRSYPASFHTTISSRAEGCTISFADGHAIFWKYNPDKSASAITAASAVLLSDGTVSAFYSAADLAQMEAWSSGPIPPGVTE